MTKKYFTSFDLLDIIEQNESKNIQFFANMPNGSNINENIVQQCKIIYKAKKLKIKFTLKSIETNSEKEFFTMDFATLCITQPDKYYIKIIS